MGCYIWYSEEGPGWTAAPPSPLLAVRSVDGPMLCGFKVEIKGLKNRETCEAVLCLFHYAYISIYIFTYLNVNI